MSIYVYGNGAPRRPGREKLEEDIEKVMERERKWKKYGESEEKFRERNWERRNLKETKEQEGIDMDKEAAHTETKKEQARIQKARQASQRDIEKQKKAGLKQNMKGGRRRN